MASPSILAGAKAARERLEAEVAFGSPVSLDSARRKLENDTNFRAEERRDIRALIDGIEALVYGDTRRDVKAAPDSAGNGVSSDAKPVSEPASSMFAPDLKLLAAAASGRTLTPPPDVAGTALGELIPALAIFPADSREAARQAQNAFDRFAQLGVASILPDLAYGLDAERRFDWKGALVHYRRVLDAAPDAWPAVIGEGRALLALGRPVSALAVLEPRATALSGVPKFTRVYAQALYENARFAEAARFVDEGLVADPQDYHLILIRAYLLIRDKSFQQAIPLLDAFGTVDPSNRQYLLLRCLAAGGLRSNEEALRWARQGLKLYPDDPELLVAAARLLYAGSSASYAEAHSLAVHAYELTTPQAAGDAATAGSDGAEHSPLAAATRREAGFEAARLLTIDAAAHYKWELAAVYLHRALSMGSFPDRDLECTVMRRTGNWAAALAYADRWRHERPDSTEATEAYLRALIGGGNERAAQDLIARLLPNSSSQALRSTLYYLQSRLQKSDEAALALLRSSLIENADNPEALAAMYDILFKRKDFTRARFYLRQALTLDPGNPELLRRQKELEAATK